MKIRYCSIAWQTLFRLYVLILDIDYVIKSIITRELFWYESSQLAAKATRTTKQKAEEKKQELEEFIRRFLLTLPSRNKQLLVKKWLVN
jgi:hypothetical protein